jgi:Tfp pilus assembly protein PilX
MPSFIFRLKSENGNVTIIAFILLVVLTLIGIFATRTAQIDLQTAYNEIPYKQNFYVAEGGVNREAAELGRGVYLDLKQNVPRNFAGVNLPGLSGKSYDCTIEYLGPFLAPKGFSAIHFSRYDYNVEARAGGGTASSGEVRVSSRLYKIGPKAE